MAEVALEERPVASVTSGEDTTEEWIDRTNEPLAEIGNGYVLTETLQSLFLTNNRITVIKNLEPCVALRELVLRQNEIKVVEGLGTLGELVDLDLYMNQIEIVPPDSFGHNTKLQKLDLSFNQLRTLEGFPCDNLGVLQELFLIGNKIKQISALHSMPELTMLELGDNRLRVIENLDALPSLEGLWLGRNKITRIQNLGALVELRRLSIQSNRIEVIEGLDHLVHLEELYLSHNGISSMDGIQNLASLRVLDLGANLIQHIEHVDCLPCLQEFWINGNRLDSFDELALLSESVHLETVYLEGNPLASDPDYSRKALGLLPNCLEQLDALLVEDIRVSLSKTVVPTDAPMSDTPAIANEAADSAVTAVPISDVATVETISRDESSGVNISVAAAIPTSSSENATMHIEELQGDPMVVSHAKDNDTRDSPLPDAPTEDVTLDKM